MSVYPVWIVFLLVVFLRGPVNGRRVTKEPSKLRKAVERLDESILVAYKIAVELGKIAKTSNENSEDVDAGDVAGVTAVGWENRERDIVLEGLSGRETTVPVKDDPEANQGADRLGGNGRMHPDEQQRDEALVVEEVTYPRDDWKAESIDVDVADPAEEVSIVQPPSDTDFVKNLGNHTEDSDVLKIPQRTVHRVQYMYRLGKLRIGGFSKDVMHVRAFHTAGVHRLCPGNTVPGINGTCRKIVRHDDLGTP